MKEALSSSETSVLTRATRRNIPDTILHSHRRENLKSYTERVHCVRDSEHAKLRTRSGSRTQCFRRRVARVLPMRALRLGATRRGPKATAEEWWSIVADRMLKQSVSCSRPTGHVGFVVSVEWPVCGGSGVILVTYVQDRRDS
jgi:hypothetical protein